MNSIRRRLLLVATIVLIAFFGLTGLVLDQANKTRAQVAVKERLRPQVYGIIAAAIIEKDTIQMPSSLPEPKFSSPISGLFAAITGNDHSYYWGSVSLLGKRYPFDMRLKKNQSSFKRIRPANGEPDVFAFSLGIKWRFEDGSSKAFTITVAESLQRYLAEISQFRNTLWTWLTAVSVILLVVQAAILRWGLRPLREVANDLVQIESGHKQSLTGNYPKELRKLTRNINRLIENERNNLKRYRDTLGDLAHSLKTPLAVLKTLVDRKNPSQETLKIIEEQTDRMNNIVTYQLQKAVAGGHTTFSTPINIHKIIERILVSLKKIYQEKEIHIEFDFDKNIEFAGEEGDLLELFGNLLDNAHKWCRRQILMNLTKIDEKDGRSGINIQIADDGPGIPDTKAQQVLERGVRADSQVEGHGLGLNIVKQIVAAYGGSIIIEKHPTLGGAFFKIELMNR